MREDFRREEVDRVWAIVGVSADRSYLVAASQGSGGGVGWRATMM